MNSQRILQEFIKTFLPPRGNKRKNTRNELARVSSTLNQVMLKYFGFRVTEPEVLAAFEELQYPIFAKKGEWNPTRKDVLPAAAGTVTHTAAPYADHNASFLYIDVSADTIRVLGLLRAEPAANTSAGKVTEHNEMEARILAFKAGIRASNNVP